MKNFIFLFFLFAILFSLNSCSKKEKATVSYKESNCLTLLQNSESQIDSLETVVNAYQEQLQRISLYGNPNYNATTSLEKKEVVVQNNLNLPEKNCQPYIFVGCRGGKYMLCISNKTGKEYKNYNPSKKDLSTYPEVNNCKSKK